MKKLFSLYRKNPSILIAHLFLFLFSLLFVPAFSIVGVIILEWPLTWLINDFFSAGMENKDIRTMLWVTSAFWMGMYLMGKQPNIFDRINREKDE
tara:strand:- start:241 stop:525 length:285 start_codon:yes stop_codon:yes gene_type:complete